MVPEPVAAAEPGWVTLRMPLVRLALGDPADVAVGRPDVAAALASPDRSPDTAETEIVLQPAPMPARCRPTSWPGRARRTCRSARCSTRGTDRDAEPRDPAAAATPAGESATEHRRTA